jgi:hypothetical protein
MLCPVFDVRQAELPGDLGAVERLWKAYLTWGNDQLEDRYGFRLSVEEAASWSPANSQ